MTSIRSTLRFSPYAWAKLVFMRDVGGTEIGGFGISHESDLLLVEDVVMIDQICTPVTVEFNDESVADFFDEQVDAGRRPEQFSRIWLHTHPGSCPRPSGTDEETFVRCFGSTDWAVMFILAREGATYGRLRFNSGPGMSTRLRQTIDCSVAFPGSDYDQWLLEYDSTVAVHDPFYARRDPLFARDLYDPRSELAEHGSPWGASEWAVL